MLSTIPRESSCCAIVHWATSYSAQSTDLSTTNSVSWPQREPYVAEFVVSRFGLEISQEEWGASGTSALRVWFPLSFLLLFSSSPMD
jgi:hypothetical protein